MNIEVDGKAIDVNPDECDYAHVLARVAALEEAAAAVLRAEHRAGNMSDYLRDYLLDSIGKGETK